MHNFKINYYVQHIEFLTDMAGIEPACVIMSFDELIDGVDDSKKVPEKKRDLLAEKIKEKARKCIRE